MAVAAVLCWRACSFSCVVPVHCQSYEKQYMHFKTDVTAQPTLIPEMNVKEQKNSITREISEMHGCVLKSTREITRLQQEEDAGNSYREYYRDVAEVGKGVPFKWESTPGTTKRDFLVTQNKERNQSEVMPPLSPLPRLKAICSFKSGGTKSSCKSLFHNMRRLLGSPSQGWA